MNIRSNIKESIHGISHSRYSSLESDLGEVFRKLAAALCSVLLADVGRKL